MSKYVCQRVTLVGAFLASACSGGVEEQGVDEGAAPIIDDVAQSELVRAWDPVVREAEFQRDVAQPLEIEQRRDIIAAFAEAGVPISEDQFVGQLLRLDDGYLELDPILEQLEASGVLAPRADGLDAADSGNVEKGQVLAQTFTGFAPDPYAEQEGNQFLFNRPELAPSTGFAHWLVIPDNAPAFLDADFTQAINDIANAAADDCLEPRFLEVHRQSDVADLDPLVAPLTRLHRVVFDTVNVACPGFPATFQGGCSNFPQVRNVTLQIAVPVPGAPGAASQRRYIYGDRLGITNGVGAGNVDLLTHELLHSLGVAHPREEVFPGSLVVAAKFNVPGTVNQFGGFQSIMHSPILVDRFNNPILDAFGRTQLNPDYSRVLSPDDIDVIRTLYHENNAPLDCQYSTDDTLVAPR
jgi:hypothetical protein